MTPIEKQAIREICENPFDDAPRLIYADWLNEQGRNERSEFIRVQIKLERTDLTCQQIFISCREFLDLEKMKELGCSRCKEFANLKLREKELFELVRKKSQLDRSQTLGSHISVFRRGFGCRYYGDLQNWISIARTCCKHNPMELLQFHGAKPVKYKSLWCWTRQNGLRRSDYVPSFLKPEDFQGNVGKSLNNRIWFKSKEDANASLSLAMINHARRQLKMPDLEWKIT